MTALSIRTFLFISLCLFFTSCQTGPDLSNINNNMATPSASAPAEKEISGTYAVNGADENGNQPYEGALTLTNQGDTYGYEIQTSKMRRTGVGVQFGDSLAATYADPGKGEGCGVVLYKIARNGVMDGRTAVWGTTGYGTEHAEQTAGSNFDGKYKVNGKTSAGEDYSGTLDVKKSLGGYQFNWHTGKDRVGYGVWRGSTAAITFGGPQCYFALYDVKSSGLLEGFTGGGNSFAFGTETAKKR